MSSSYIPNCDGLSVEELDQKLEQAVAEHERSESHICFYLHAFNERRGFVKFGFRNIHDYAYERFSFSDRKTAYLISLARKLEHLPQITAALKEGRIRWFKAYKIASIAQPDNEVMWLESALSMAVRDLDRKIQNEVGVTYTKFRFSLSEDQAAVVEHAIEVCRRVAGAELSSDQCLEYIAGEFLATYAHEAHLEESCEDEPKASHDDLMEQVKRTPEDQSACPDNGDLPSTRQVPPSKQMLAVFERDGYCCTYPGCSARAMLHDHHIKYRSKFGSKRSDERDLLTNRTTLCAFHHRLLHAGVIGLEGQAPLDLTWRKPALMDAALLRGERKAVMFERRKNRQPHTDAIDLELQRLQLTLPDAPAATLAADSLPFDNGESAMERRENSM
jgi:hypothetical protein